MKMFIPLLCLLALTIAEPPLGDGYASAKSSHGYDNDFQRSLSQHYGPPSQIPASRNSLSSEYGTPKAWPSNKLSSTYSLPTSRISEEYGVPTVRSGVSKISQEYGLPGSRNSPSDVYGVPKARNSPSLEYGVPSARTLSQKYGIPKSRNALSQEYGIPADNLQEYGLPSSRVPSQEYGKPIARKHGSRTIESSPSTLYGAPRSDYGTPERGIKPHSQYLPQKHSPSKFNEVSKSLNPKSITPTEHLSTYGVPKLDTLSYEVPLSSDYSQGFNDFGSRTSEYGTSSRALSQKYGAPLKTDAVASSYSRIPSSNYGVPSTRDAIPSEVYGVPEQYNSRSSEGYEYGRAGDEDIQEPANYGFTYKVNDFITGSDFGHTESRQDNRAEGSYFVVLPDGTKQVVEYEADERGFKPRISVEPAETRSGGYDDNAADLINSDGPY